MNGFGKWVGAAAIVLLAVGCKKHTLGPDEVDTSVPPPKSANEPAGFTPVANRGFNALEEDNWIYGGDPNAYRKMDAADAPQSRPAIARITMPAGFASGGTPVFLERNIKSNDHIYVNAYFRISENWKKNRITDMLIALWAGGQPRAYLGWRADADGNGMHPTALITTEKGEGGSLWLDPNLNTSLVVRPGVWHHLEVEIQSSMGNTGRFVLWIDNVKIASYDNVPFNLVDQNRHWDMVQVGPAWGGLTEPLDQTQWLDMDHVYLSAKTL
jgi:hypothetical protein